MKSSEDKSQPTMTPRVMLASSLFTVLTSHNAKLLRMVSVEPFICNTCSHVKSPLTSCKSQICRYKADSRLATGVKLWLLLITPGQWRQ